MAKEKDFMLDLDKADGKPQRRLIFKRKRGGVVLSREQVRAIKKGRKKLRKEMKSRGIKGREEFKLMASSMGLYFDQSRFWMWLGLLRGKGFWAFLGSLLALLGALFLYSLVTQLQGHFTINMSDSMFREGFVLSETSDFANPVTHLFCEPAQDVPCVSISHLPSDIDTAYEGQHNETYFAYTYFLRNEGESTVDYTWTVSLNSESKDLSSACWVMIFEDGEMMFYAKPTAGGGAETLPAYNDNSRGYIGMPLGQFARDADSQYQLIASRGSLEYYRLVPKSFLSDTVIAMGEVEEVAPQDVHKYTVVIWLEGDDPDCTDELIGGHLGMQMDIQVSGEVSETADSGQSSTRSFWNDLWSNLKFWKG